MPQHGFARNSNWEFLGKSSSESLGKDRKEGDDSVSLDFGLTHAMLSEDFRKAWPYEFGLVYSVTLSKEGLGTSLQVQNKGSQDFEFQVLLHTYLSVEVGLYYLAPRARDASGNRITDDLARISPRSVSTTSNPRRTSIRRRTRPHRPKPTPRCLSLERQTGFTSH